MMAKENKRQTRCAFQPQEKMFLNVSFMEMMTQKKKMFEKHTQQRECGTSMNGFSSSAVGGTSMNFYVLLCTECGTSTNFYVDPCMLWSAVVFRYDSRRSICNIEFISRKGLHEGRLRYLTRGEARTRKRKTPRRVLINVRDVVTTMKMRQRLALGYSHVG